MTRLALVTVLGCAAVLFAAQGAWAAVGPWDADVSDFPRLAEERGDAARIQRAVAAAGKGGVVWFPKGEYDIDAMLVVSNQCSLWLHKSAHLKAVKEMPFVLKYFGREMETNGNVYGCVDHNLFIRGGDIDGMGLASCAHVMGVRHFTLADTTYRNGRKVGLQLGDPSLPRSVEGGYEVFANNLYFICNLPGLAGNVGFRTHIGDSHFTDLVVVDYTVGIRDTKWSNRFTRCHVWGGIVKKDGTKNPEYLPDSIAFDLNCEDAVLTDCYADTAMTGFRIRGNMRIFNCGYFNNWLFKMDNPVVFRHEAGSLVVTGGRFSKNSPHATLYLRGPKAGRLFWRDNQPINFTAEEMKAIPTEDNGNFATSSKVAGAGEIHVSPYGDDGAEGAFGAPVKTLRRAQELARKAVRETGGATVFLRGGEYPVRETLALTAADSGTTWKAYGEERPVLTGAFRLGKFAPVGDAAMKARFSEAVRGKVRETDVKAVGYDGFEPYAPSGLYVGVSDGGKAVRRANTLYRNGRRLMLAREPDEGFIRTGEVLGNGAFGWPGHVFRVSLPELPRLGRADAPDLVACGYFQYLWDDENLRAVANPTAGVVRIDWLRDHRACKGRPFFLQNAPALLDSPGEWYLDRGTGKLYLLPPKDAAEGDEYVLAGCAKPFLTVDGAHDVRIEGLVFEYGRGDAITVEHASHVELAGNVVRNFGGIGLIAEGTGLLIRGNLLYGFGHGAMRVTGGDRKTLTSSQIRIEGNDVSDTGFVQRCYTPGVRLDGCGTKVVFNRFHDLPSSALRIEGNDYDIVSNLVERVVTESDDQGGCDMFGNPTYAGTVFRHNVWRDIVPRGNAPCGRAGIRFDDAISNQKVYGNRFHNCSVGGFGGVQIHGGRRNIVSNNLFSSCSSAVSITPWSRERWRSHLKGDYFLKQKIDVDSPIYVARYPGIEKLPDLPMTNTVCCNVLVGVGRELGGRPPSETGVWGNRKFAKMPSDAELKTIPGFAIPPTPDEVGPRPGEPLLRCAKRNGLAGR